MKQTIICAGITVGGLVVGAFGFDYFKSARRRAVATATTASEIAVMSMENNIAEAASAMVRLGKSNLQNTEHFFYLMDSNGRLRKDTILVGLIALAGIVSYYLGKKESQTLKDELASTKASLQQTQQEKNSCEMEITRLKTTVQVLARNLKSYSDIASTSERSLTPSEAGFRIRSCSPEYSLPEDSFNSTKRLHSREMAYFAQQKRRKRYARYNHITQKLSHVTRFLNKTFSRRQTKMLLK